MKRRQNHSDRASALRISLSIALSVSAVLLATGAPNNSKKTLPKITAPAQSSGVVVPLTFTAASSTTTLIPCGRIAFSSSNRNYDGGSRIYVMNEDGSNPIQLPNKLAGESVTSESEPSFSRDGSKIAFSSGMAPNFGNRDIYIMNADGSNQSRLTNTPNVDDINPTLSPDTSKIAFVSLREVDGHVTYDIYLMDADGSNQARLTNMGAFAAAAYEPTFSPDGSKIAFTWGRSGGTGQTSSDIYIMNADGSNQTPLTNTMPPYSTGGASFSPDGSKIAFHSNRDGFSEIYIMNANGTNQTRLTHNGTNAAGNLSPSFSPDGSKIAFYRGVNGNYHIYVMNADGSNQVQLTFNPATDQFPSFGPCQPVLIGLEVTQGVQDLNNSVPLVEHKKTFVRAHVKNPWPADLLVSASLIAKDTATGLILGTIPNSNVGGRITIPQNPLRACLNDSFLFEVPLAWIRGTVEFSLAGNGLSFACEGGGDACSKATVTFRPTNPLSMKFVQLAFKDAAGIDHKPTDADVARVKAEFLGRYPISNFDTVTQAARTNFNACLGIPVFVRLLRELNSLRYRDCSCGPCKDFYQALLADQSQCVPAVSKNGAGDQPGNASVVFATTDDTIARIHEQGHVMGFKHTKYRTAPPFEECADAYGNKIECTSLEGDGTLSLSKEQYAASTVYGFDVNNSSPNKIYPAETADFMSYGRPRWPSRANYGLLFEKFVLPDPPRPTVQLNRPNVLANQTVIIDGTIQLNEPSGQLGSVIVNPTPAPISLPAPGDYSIRLENSQGVELASFSFNPILGSEDFTTGIISLLLPWDPTAKRIVLLHNGDVLDSRQASTKFPSVNVTFPNGDEVLTGSNATFTWTAADPDADTLNYTLEYSADNGTTWETLTINWNSNSFPVDLTKLRGSSQALVRVTASDGFNCAVAQSQGTFTVPDHAPTASISSPEDNRLYVADQAIILEGTGFDVEDGTLSGSRLTWTSDLNGPLGTGTSIAIAASTLQEGTHTITLTATDNTGQIGNALLSIRIFRARPALPSSLSIAPGELTFISTNEQIETQTVGIRNGGDGDLDWSASVNQAWIYLGSATGSMPSNLDIGVDATDLAPGQYTGQVTIDAPGALDSPQVVTVNLFVPINSTPTPSPTPTATPQATASSTPTATPTATATATPNSNPTATPSPTPSPTPTATPILGSAANISTRLEVGTDDNVLIEGFIVQGAVGSSKKIMVRAIGPSLSQFGITDALPNPILEIHDASNAIVATNNDWKTTQIGGLITGDQFAEINASGVSPGNDLESAIIAPLEPGSYTAVVRGAGSTTGTGVVDAFDLDAGSAARLANIATRGLVQPGDKLMIAGFIVQNGPVKVVVRAIGPSLVQFGISNALPDTSLQLRDQQGAVVLENDDWKTSQQKELENTGLQPTNDLEAALLATIQPGQYTAQVRGKGNASGVGVVQVYFLQ